jgi:hypothetical protein
MTTFKKTQVAEVIVTQEMLDAIETATDYVKQRVDETGGILEVEQRVPIGKFTGEDGATGTADVVLMYGETIETMDFKYGRHKVYAYDVIESAIEGLRPERRRMNLQLACYNLGALEKFGGLFEFKFAKATILQPFLGHISDFDCSIDELLAIRDFLRDTADETRTLPVYRPTGDNCYFCRASPCEAQTTAVLKVALIGDDVTTATVAPISMNKLGSLYDAIPMITGWCKAVANKVIEELNAKRPVVRNDGLQYKLVEGQKGDRKWKDEEEAEGVLKNTMRLPDAVVYRRKLISPANAEALSKKKRDKSAPPPVIGQTQWNRLKELITQSDGSPSVALETDPRPALGKSAADGFGDVSAADDCSDLFKGL